MKTHRFETGDRVVERRGTDPTRQWIIAALIGDDKVNIVSDGQTKMVSYLQITHWSPLPSAMPKNRPTQLY